MIRETSEKLHLCILSLAVTGLGLISQPVKAQFPIPKIEPQPAYETTSRETLKESQKRAQARRQTLSEKTFQQYISQYSVPEFFQDNSQAFDARLKLLDEAPAGAKVKILTFVFDNGEVTRRLGRHICMAAQRGVVVEFMADSKTGDRPGEEDVFDGNVHHKINEELYQYMANCGARVYVHNHLPDFVELIGGVKAPRLSEGTWAGWFGDTAQTIHTVKRLGSRFKKILREEFKGAFNKSDGEAFLASVEKIILGVVEAKVRKQDILAEIETGLNELKANPLWETIDQKGVQEIRRRVDSLRARLWADSEFQYAIAAIRRFNRLNHRKLFSVQLQNGEGCFFLGGRNLGDHYLANHHDSFLDADVLYCSHHGSSTSANLLKDVSSSFDNLLHDLSDGVLSQSTDAKVNRVYMNVNYVFRHLKVAPELRVRSSEYLPIAARDLPDVKDDDRSVLPEKVWENRAPIRGLPLYSSYDWSLLRSHWHAKGEAGDEVKDFLVRSIQNEQSEVYIETAYSELDESFRNSIESALQRGVKVHLVTNSLFISDGPSKLIRIFMAFWVRELLKEHKGLFRVDFTTFEAGHMIHYKGAAFRCQLGESGAPPYKSSLIGSHNFHPRSGYSDKEHALTWRQPADRDCSTKVLGEKGDKIGPDFQPDMITYRDEYYKSLNTKMEGRLLRAYPSLYAELKHVVSLPEKPEYAEAKKLASRLLVTLYDENGELRGQKVTEKALLILRETGIRDLLGTLL